MAQGRDPRALLLAARQALVESPVWSCTATFRVDDESSESYSWEAVVRPGVELMRWPASPAPIEHAVLFTGEDVHVFGGMWIDTLAPRRTDPRALVGRWVQCNAAWFRRQEHDHDPLGMLLKSVKLRDEDTITLESMSPDQRYAQVRVDGPEVAVYQIVIGVSGPRIVGKIEDWCRIELGYDDAPFEMPVLSEVMVVSHQDALTLLTPRRRRGRMAVVGEQPQVKVAPVDDDSGSWSVTSYNLAEVLGVANNHDADHAVRQFLATRDPQLLERLAFDSEDAMFAAYAVGEADALALSVAIAALRTNA